MIAKGWMVAGAIAACAICLGIGTTAGWISNGWRWEAKVAEAEREARDNLEALEAAREKLKEEKEARQKEADRASLLEEQLADAEAEVIVEEVIKYVQADNTGGCALPPEWVRIHNQAAGVPGARATEAAAREADGAAGTAITDRDALPVVTSNYARARECIARLQGLQGWILAEQE